MVKEKCEGRNCILTGIFIAFFEHTSSSCFFVTVYSFLGSGWSFGVGTFY